MMKRLILPVCLGLMVGACSETTQVSDDLAESQGDASNPTGRTERVGSNPGERAVRIGEGGPRFDACQAVGRVTGLRGAELDVRIAPFDSAKSKDKLSEAKLVYICTRSHDQQWLGIVYAKAAAPTADTETTADDGDSAGDCGVTSPVRSKRNYDGPCESGWVESTFVKLVAG